MEKIKMLGFIAYWQRILKKEEGSALVIVFLCTLLISGMIVALLYSSSTNALGSGTYRTESETLMVADSGLQKALDWFTSTYVATSTPSTVYDLTKSPVMPLSGAGGSSTSPVKFSTYPGQSNNVPTVLNASSTTFGTAFGTSSGVSLNDNSSVLQGKYVVDATLLSVDLKYPTLPVERWAIKVKSAKNFIASSNNELSAIIEVGVKVVALPAVVARNSLYIDTGANTHTINTNGANATSTAFPAGFGGYLDTPPNGNVASNGSTTTQIAVPAVNVRGSILQYPSAGSCSCPSSTYQGSIQPQSTPLVTPNPSSVPGTIGSTNINVTGTTTITTNTNYQDLLISGGTLVIDATTNPITVTANILTMTSGQIRVLGNNTVTLNIKNAVNVTGGKINVDASGNLRPPTGFNINTGGADLHFNGSTVVVSANVVLTTSGTTGHLENGATIIGSLIADYVHFDTGATAIQDLSNSSSVTKGRYRLISWSKNNSF